MSEEKSKCCPKGKEPKKCSPEQIKECHPKAKDEHPCEDETKKDKPKE